MTQYQHEWHHHDSFSSKKAKYHSVWMRVRRIDVRLTLALIGKRSDGWTFFVIIIKIPRFTVWNYHKSYRQNKSKIKTSFTICNSGEHFVGQMARLSNGCFINPTKLYCRNIGTLHYFDNCFVGLLGRINTPTILVYWRWPIYNVVGQTTRLTNESCQWSDI
jgi:hypothetical protein